MRLSLLRYGAVAIVTFACAVLSACSDASSSQSEQGAAAPNSGASPPRLAVLSPSLGLIVADLGLTDRIVARHGYDKFLPQSIPVAGDQAGIDYERLLKAKPTHVLLEWGSRTLPVRLTRLAVEKGWQVRSFRVLSIGDVRVATRAIADLLGDDATQQAATSALRDLDEALAPDARVAQALGRTLILYFTDPIGAAGPDAAISQVVTALGATLALSDAASFVTLDREDLLALDPDSILLLAPGADAQQARENPLSFLGDLASLPLRAVRSGRVGVVTNRTARSASAQLRDVAREIREIAERMGRAKPHPQDAASTG